MSICGRQSWKQSILLGLVINYLAFSSKLNSLIQSYLRIESNKKAYPSWFAVCLRTQLYLTAMVDEIESKRGANMHKDALNSNIQAYMTSSLPTLSNLPSAVTAAFLISILNLGILILLNFTYPLSCASKPPFFPISPSSTPRFV